MILFPIFFNLSNAFCSGDFSYESLLELIGGLRGSKKSVFLKFKIDGCTDDVSDNYKVSILALWILV